MQFFRSEVKRILWIWKKAFRCACQFLLKNLYPFHGNSWLLWGSGKGTTSLGRSWWAQLWHHVGFTHCSSVQIAEHPYWRIIISATLKSYLNITVEQSDLVLILIIYDKAVQRPSTAVGTICSVCVYLYCTHTHTHSNSPSLESRPRPKSRWPYDKADCSSSIGSHLFYLTEIGTFANVCLSPVRLSVSHWCFFMPSCPP